MPVANTADKYFLGSSVVDRLYCGPTLVWSRKLLVSDNFNRANGGLGSNWTTWNPSGGDLPLTIASNQCTCAHDANQHGGTRTAESYANDQYSQVEIVSVALNAWVGVVVRDNGTVGQNHYLAIAFNNGGTPEIDLYKRVAGTFSFLQGSGGSFNIAGGDVFRLSVIGTTLTVSLNGVARITKTDSTFANGKPGIGLYAANTFAVVDNWQGGEL